MKATKDNKLLSFGDEAEDDEAEIDKSRADRRALGKSLNRTTASADPMRRAALRWARRGAPRGGAAGGGRLPGSSVGSDGGPSVAVVRAGEDSL